VIARDPKDVRAHRERGEAWFNKKDYDRAIADYDQAIVLDPKDARAYLGRGFAYGRKRDFDRTIADLDRAIALDPKDPYAYVRRGSFCVSIRHEYDRAIADANSAITLASKYAAAYLIRGTAYDRKGDHGQAIADYGQAITLAPKDALNYQIRGNAYNLQGETDRAIADFDKAIALDPKGADAGHGIETGGVNYLIPVDAKLADERDVTGETVSMGELLKAIDHAKMLRLVILDACRNNPFKANWGRTGASRDTAVERGFVAPPEKPAGTLVVYAAKDGGVAADEVAGSGNSPFARAFVNRIKVPGLEIRRVFDYVREDVLEATGAKQQPFTYGSLGVQDYYFVPGGAAQHASR
jgi:tetratricopeptide (TPR) repeat protein